MTSARRDSGHVLAPMVDENRYAAGRAEALGVTVQAVRADLATQAGVEQTYERMR